MFTIIVVCFALLQNKKLGSKLYFNLPNIPHKEKLIFVNNLFSHPSRYGVFMWNSCLINPEVGRGGSKLQRTCGRAPAVAPSVAGAVVERSHVVYLI